MLPAIVILKLSALSILSVFFGTQLHKSNELALPLFSALVVRTNYALNKLGLNSLTLGISHSSVGFYPIQYDNVCNRDEWRASLWADIASPVCSVHSIQPPTFAATRVYDVSYMQQTPVINPRIGIGRDVVAAWVLIGIFAFVCIVAAIELRIPMPIRFFTLTDSRDGSDHKLPVFNESVAELVARLLCAGPCCSVNHATAASFAMLQDESDYSDAWTFSAYSSESDRRIAAELECQQLKAQIVTGEKLCERLDDLYSNLLESEALCATLSTAQDANKARIVAGSIKIGDLTHENARLQSENAALTLSIAKLTKNKDYLSDAKDSISSALLRESLDLSVVQNNLTNALAREEAGKLQVDKLENAVAVHLAEIAECRSQIVDIESLRQQIVEITKERDDAKAAVDPEALELLQAQRDDARRELSMAEEIIKDSAASIDVLKHTQVELEEKLAGEKMNADNKCKKLIAKLANVKVDAKQAHEELETLKHESTEAADLASARISTLEVTLQEANAKMANFSKGLVHAQRTRDDARSRITELEAEIVTIQAQLVEAQTAAAAAAEDAFPIDPPSTLDCPEAKRYAYYRSCVATPFYILNLDESKVQTLDGIDFEKQSKRAKLFHNTAMPACKAIAQVMEPAYKTLAAQRELQAVFDLWNEKYEATFAKRRAGTDLTASKRWALSYDAKMKRAIKAYSDAIETYEVALPDSTPKSTFPLAERRKALAVMQSAYNAQLLVIKRS